MLITLQRIACFIDDLSEYTGRVIAWLTLGTVLLTFTVVVLRYGFDAGSIAMQEAISYLHAAVFMLGAAYTLQQDGHVRVDIFYRTMRRRTRAIVDLAGVLLFLLPFCAYLAWVSLDFAAAAWSMREITREPGGLPFPAIPLLKSIVIIMPLTLALQGLSMLLRATRTLRGS